MTIDGLIKHINSLNEHLLAYQNGNDLTVKLDKEVIINLGVDELDQNDYDWYPERIHLGPYTTYRLFNFIKGYIDTPINSRGVILNNYYVLKNHRYLVRVTRFYGRYEFHFIDTWGPTDNDTDDMFIYRVSGNGLQFIKDSGLISKNDTLITKDEATVRMEIEKYRNIRLFKEESK